MSHSDHYDPCTVCGASFAGYELESAIQAHDLASDHEYAGWTAGVQIGVVTPEGTPVADEQTLREILTEWFEMGTWAYDLQVEHQGDDIWLVQMPKALYAEAEAGGGMIFVDSNGNVAEVPIP